MPLKDVIEPAMRTAVGLLPAPMRTSLHRNAGAQLKPAARRTYEDGACVVNVPLGLQLWRDRGFSPKFIVDCGAYTGQWSTMAHAIWPAATIAMVEPQSSKLPLIEKVAGAIGNGATANQVQLGRRGRAVDDSLDGPCRGPVAPGCRASWHGSHRERTC